MDHHTPSVFVPGKGYKNGRGVVYDDGTVYRTHFASFAVCTDWCKRYLDGYCNVEVK